MTRPLIFTLALGLAACATPEGLEAPEPSVEESASFSIQAGTYVLELSPERQAQLDAAQAAFEANPEDLDAKIAFRQLEGATYQALEVKGDIVRLIGQGRARTLSAGEIALEERADGDLLVKWLQTGKMDVAREVVR